MEPDHRRRSVANHASAPGCVCGLLPNRLVATKPANQLRRLAFCVWKRTCGPPCFWRKREIYCLACLPPVRSPWQPKKHATTSCPQGMQSLASSAKCWPQPITARIVYALAVVLGLMMFILPGLYIAVRGLYCETIAATEGLFGIRAFVRKFSSNERPVRRNNGARLMHVWRRVPL